MDSGQEAATTSVSLAIDTTSRSILHRLARGRRTKGKTLSLTKAYIVAVSCTYVPLALSALMGPWPLWEPVAGLLKLPFLKDVNIGFMFLFTFPAILYLIITDQPVLSESLQQVQREGIVSIPGDAAKSLVARWEARFGPINIGIQSFAIILGVVSAYLDYNAYSSPGIGYWITDRGGLIMPLGPVFLFCVGLFFACLSTLVLRSLAITVLLNDLVASAKIKVLPFHPDGSGGLRPVGDLGLRNQYGLTVCGLNVLLFYFVSRHYLGSPAVLKPMIIANVVGYTLFGPLVFIGPLLQFRAGMRRTKNQLLSEVAQRLHTELERLRGQLKGGQVTKEDEELIDRLGKVGHVIQAMPVWPFDVDTVKKFFAAYGLPIIGSIVGAFWEHILKLADSLF